MINTLRKSVLLVVMAIALLAGLFGWTMKMEAAPPFPLHHSSIHANQALSSHSSSPNHYCPPPPFSCL
jgi:hypothetical protein